MRQAMNAIFYLLRTGSPWRDAGSRRRGLLLDKVRRLSWLECVFADSGYDAQQTYEAAAANHPLRLEVVRCNPHAIGFEVIKRRWVV